MELLNSNAVKYRKTHSRKAKRVQEVQSGPFPDLTKKE